MDAAASSGDPAERLAALAAVRDIYLEHISDSGRLPTLNLKSPDMKFPGLGPWEHLQQELLWACRCEAWSNPKWRDWVTRCQKESAEDGYGDYWWIWSLWQMRGKLPHI